MQLPPLNESVMRLVVGKLFDSYALELLENRVITVSQASGLILDVQPVVEHDINYSHPDVLDMRHLTVLPGFVDTHVHLFLHPYSETPWEDQLTKESTAERTVRATVHAKRTLMAGFTAVRDLGTEGAGDADIALRKCLSGSNPDIPGPRYFCANRAIVSTGSYGPKSSVYVSREGIDGVMGAEVADGRDECVRAVRRQIGAGADWIKIYADYRSRSRLAGVSTAAGQESIRTFSRQELEALITTAHLYGVKVAAHASNDSTAEDLIDLGVDSVEHGYDIRWDDSKCSRLSHSRTTWVPTLSAYYTISQGRGGTWERAASAFKAALAHGMSNIACGGDTGVFAHGENALEMKLMVRLGADWRQVLRWGTLGGWECIRSTRWEGEVGRKRVAGIGKLEETPETVGDNEVPFGAVRRGFAADLIATTGDLAGDFEGATSASSIVFVMKGGRIYKQYGRSVID